MEVAPCLSAIKFWRATCAGGTQGRTVRNTALGYLDVNIKRCFFGVGGRYKRIRRPEVTSDTHNTGRNTDCVASVFRAPHAVITLKHADKYSKPRVAVRPVCCSRSRPTSPIAGLPPSGIIQPYTVIMNARIAVMLCLMALPAFAVAQCTQGKFESAESTAGPGGLVQWRI